MFDDQIQEGQFVESKLAGFGRLIYNTGAYYVGFFKQGKFHGYGYFHFAEGGCKEGLWKEHKLLNRLTDSCFDDTPEVGKKFEETKYLIKADDGETTKDDQLKKKSQTE